jgi:flagellar hook-length control protein FliK
MDNHRVKEALEKNMEEFKDNLNRQGYSLEACAVMVGQHKNDSDGTRQQFTSAWEQLSVNGVGASNRLAAAGDPGESLRQIAALHSARWPESSISVFA